MEFFVLTVFFYALLWLFGALQWMCKSACRAVKWTCKALQPKPAPEKKLTPLEQAYQRYAAMPQEGVADRLQSVLELEDEVAFIIEWGDLCWPEPAVLWLNSEGNWEPEEIDLGGTSPNPTIPSQLVSPRSFADAAYLKLREIDEQLAAVKEIADDNERSEHELDLIERDINVLRNELVEREGERPAEEIAVDQLEHPIAHVVLPGQAPPPPAPSDSPLARPEMES